MDLDDLELILQDSR